jgi:hypothetical protein
MRARTAAQIIWSAVSARHAHQHGTLPTVILSLRRISKRHGRSHREWFRMGTVVAF